ncbi:hypothetical protein ALP8811_01002 [Aliiroseovarius pelagivivens]|uniref:FAD-binding domain-containing protein n=1 Tax=Aliiroseovarius pelagivivens TaxID=1639690 RepID=A0A2R8AIZ4_9RHOB|nr:NAD(P)/FAD-dependent oxidoreductase [Aliiroseovarius pelagivivens]SPF76006.1 hypothetical protein ALP8811_01002 [Aliiroseovarius pelagivivens]
MNKRVFKHSHYDAVIIGARCAGAATGIELARAGARVLLIDRDEPGNDTLSTHALMRPAISLLNDWGVLPDIEKAKTPLVSVTNFHYGAEKISVDIKPDGAIKGLYAPRRGILDRLLADKAVDFGAELHTGVSFQSASKDSQGRVCGAHLVTADGRQMSVSCNVLIGADGRQSTVASAVGAATQVEGQERSAVVYGYFDEIPNDGYRWFFGRDSYSGAIPTNAGAHCVFAAVHRDAFKDRFGPDPLAGMQSVVAECDPDLAQHLQRGSTDGRLRRFGGAPSHMRDCAGPGWALVGDAGYFKDPATAHGITDAFLDAHRLAQALGGNPSNPLAYQLQRNAQSRRLFDITQKVAALNWNHSSLKALHRDLNLCMKAEYAELRGPNADAAQAA